MRIPFLLLTILLISLQCNASPVGGSWEVKNLRFYIHNTHSGNDPFSVLVAQNTNATSHARGLVPFSSVYVLIEGPASTSRVVGNAQGMYIETGKDGYTILETIDCEITDGAFKGSSFVMFSRNQFSNPSSGRGACVPIGPRLGLLRTVCVDCLNSINPSKGYIIEYNVILYLR